MHSLGSVCATACPSSKKVANENASAYGGNLTTGAIFSFCSFRLEFVLAATQPIDERTDLCRRQPGSSMYSSMYGFMSKAAWLQYVAAWLQYVAPVCRLQYVCHSPVCPSPADSTPADYARLRRRLAQPIPQRRSKTSCLPHPFVFLSAYQRDARPKRFVQAQEQ
jgi:hypothetical protein